MHIPLAIDPDFTQGWFENKTGAGTVTINDDYILRTAGLTIGAAQKKNVVHLCGGDEVVFDVMARNLSGIGYVFIDAEGAGTALNREAVIDKNWRRYTLKQVVNGAAPYTQVVCGVGIFGSVDGECEYRDPRISVNAREGFQRVYAQGLIRISSSVVDLIPGFHEVGIEELSLISNTEILVSYNRKNLYENKRPIVQASYGTDGGRPFWVQVGHGRAAGTCRISLRDGSDAGKAVDLTTLTGTHYVSFSAVG